MVTLDEERPFQFTLRTLFLATTFTAFFLGLGIYLEMPLLFPTIAIPVAGYGAWQGTRANRAGIVLAVVGGEVLTLFGYGACIATDNLGFHLAAFLSLSGAGLLLVGAAMFFASACNRKPARWQNVFCFSVSLSAPLLWFLVGLPIANNALQARTARRNAQNADAMRQIVDDVNAVCARLGQAPESVKELAGLLKKDMPSIDVGYGPYPIHYSRLGPNRFQLSFINERWNISLYDSQTPKRGWYEEPF
jgi:hypothetical protein